MLKKFMISLFVLMVLVACAPTISYETSRVLKDNYYQIDNWKRNGIKIIHIDTVGNYFIVKYR